LKSPDSDLRRWFHEQILPHEPALRAYLQARFPSLPDKDDVVQEAYVRVMQAHESGGVRYAKAFLFTTARNAALDVFRRRSAKPTEEINNFTESTVLEESPNAADDASKRQELEILTAAIEHLPERCRQVIILRYLEGLSYKEVAARLDISTETVKVQIAKGMRRCTEYFVERGLIKPPPAEPS
jgi:RNA polymerase sigma-70 factor (ECF subfamily)